MKLTTRQFDVYYSLGRFWVRPMDIGGKDQSHHSNTLRQLVRKGLVERNGGPGLGGRGSYRYRLSRMGARLAAEIIAAGIAADEAYQESRSRRCRR